MKHFRNIALVIGLAILAANAWSCRGTSQAEMPAPSPTEDGREKPPPTRTDAPAEDATAGDDALAAEIARRYQIAGEQRRIQAARLTAEARTWFLSGDAERALIAVNHALRLDPSADGAVALAARIRGSVGGATGGADAVTERETARRRAAAERAESEVLSLLQRGDTAMGQNDAATAVQCYSDALLILESSTTRSPREDEVRTRLEKARLKLPRRR